jgi:WD40-like Beta Propeller Repeat
MLRARRLTRPLTSVAVALVCAVTAPTARGASLFDPALKFRVLRTEHFRIYFHQGEDRLAIRLSAIAEDAWRALERPLGVRPPRLTHVVIADQTEQANGYATPLPYDTIVIYPTWPRGAEFATDDWLRLVITHEFTHIVHLDRSESWARIVRNIFGRTVIAFPNLFLPTWQIEGLATYEESAITGEGRLHAGDFRVIVEEATRQNALEPLDRVNGGLTDWPTGQAPYAYGVGFHQYLADRFGAEKLAELAKATARRVPYTFSPVFRRIFGQSLGGLWTDYERALVAASGPPALDAGVSQLTHHGFVAVGPRFDPFGGGIVYSKRTPDGFPTLQRIDGDGGHATELATRYFGSTTGFSKDTIYFDQLEYRRNVAVLADLCALDRKTGRIRVIKGGSRLRDPDFRYDQLNRNGLIVAAREDAGRRELVLLNPNPSPVYPRTVVVLLSEADTQFNAPRWSPDGNRVAVERHRLGYDPEIIVVELALGRVSVVAAAAGTRIVMPAWRPDGRAIVAAVARDDQVFNLYEFPVGSDGVPRQLTHTTSGATWPDVSDDGKTIVFVGYTTAGNDVFSMPYPIAPGATPLEPPLAQSTATAVSQDRSASSEPYSPIETLRPTSWSPEIVGDSDQVRLGAAVFGSDVLGYHWYAASATWLVASPGDAPTPAGASPDWSVSYTYNRWWPALFATASLETSFFVGPATDRGTPSAATRREREVQAGLVLPFVKARTRHTASLSILRSVDDFTLVDRTFDRERTALRTSWRSSTARTYGYSISPEDGVTVGATAEFVRRALGASEDATIITGDARAYLRGVRPHHVIAVRAAGGVSSGDPTVGRTFLLGGAGPDLSVTDFGNDAISLLRGFAADSFAGSHVALINADYRWPLARPQRGHGTWPLFLHTLHGAAFVDAGNTWMRSFDAESIKTSIGAEFSGNLIIGFYFPLTATAGVAWGHDGSGVVRDGAIGYFRAGISF